MAIVSTAVVAALAVAPVSAAWAQQSVSGRLEHIEPASRTLHFQDGRIVTLEPGATLWVDGRQLPIETLRRGMTVVVRDGGDGRPAAAAPAADPARMGQRQPSAQAQPVPSTRAVPSVVHGHPRVTVSGTVARVDPDRGLVTFRDGRTLAVERGQVWSESTLNDIQPGAQVLLRDAQPAAYPGMSHVTPDRMRMGRVVEVDQAQSMVLLDSGTWVRIAPTTRTRLNGQDTATQAQIQPGDELIVVISQLPAQGPVQSRPSAQAGAPAASRDESQPAVGPSPSAMAREGLVERGRSIQADEVHIFRRPQSP